MQFHEFNPDGTGALPRESPGLSRHKEDQMTSKATTAHWQDFAGSEGALLTRHLNGWLSHRRPVDDPDRAEVEGPSPGTLSPIVLITLSMLWIVLTLPG